MKTLKQADLHESQHGEVWDSMAILDETYGKHVEDYDGRVPIVHCCSLGVPALKNPFRCVLCQSTIARARSYG